MKLGRGRPYYSTRSDRLGVLWSEGLAPAGKSWLYVFVTGPFSKIGITQNLVNRWMGVCSGCPMPVHLAEKFGPIDTVAARVVERFVHSMLKAHRAEGEWFRVEAPQAVSAVKEAIHVLL